MKNIDSILVMMASDKLKITEDEALKYNRELLKAMQALVNYIPNDDLIKLTGSDIGWFQAYEDQLVVVFKFLQNYLKNGE
jgi:hypothetical protein